MTAVSLSVFRFEGAADRIWAFSQMLAARRPLARSPGLRFYRLFGTGADDGFNPKPNLGVYAVMTSWTSLEAAQAGQERPVFTRYRDHAAESWTVHLRPTRARGRWGGVEPFGVEGPPPADDGGAIAVLTRATVRLRHLRKFWAEVPPIRARLEGGPRPLFQLGMGERPWVNQVTFSVWRDQREARAFAYGQGAHRRAVERVRAEDWFREELYAHFAVVGGAGSWSGRDPLAA